MRCRALPWWSQSSDLIETIVSADACPAKGGEYRPAPSERTAVRGSFVFRRDVRRDGRVFDPKRTGRA